MRISDWSSDVCSSDLVQTVIHSAHRLTVAAMSSKLWELEDPPELTAGEKNGGHADDDDAVDEKRSSAKAEEKRSRRGASNRLKGDVGQFRRVRRQE